MDFFGTGRLFSIFLSLKRLPLQVFSYFAAECMLINPKGSPFLHFLALCDILKKKIQKFQIFKKNVLRFLSLRYSADFRRLVYLNDFWVYKKVIIMGCFENFWPLFREIIDFILESEFSLRAKRFPQSWAFLGKTFQLT